MVFGPYPILNRPYNSVEYVRLVNLLDLRITLLKDYAVFLMIMLYFGVLCC